MLSLLIVFAVATAASLVLTPLARRCALRFHLLDAPDGQRKRQRQAVPLGGGVALFLSLAIGCGAAGGIASPFPFVLLTAAGLLSLLGCADDRWALKPRWKLLGQMAATIPLLWTGDWPRHVLLAGHEFDIGAWGLPLTWLWLLAGINALNFLDGIDGLCGLGGLALTSTAAALAAGVGQFHLLPTAAALAGAICGVLAFNLPPARIYLGDSGSMVIGLCVAYLAWRAPAPLPGTCELTCSVTLLAVPLIDVLLAVLRRGLRGEAVWSPDRGHLHHVLLERGLTLRQSLGLLSGLCLATGGLAWAASFWQQDAIAWIALPTLFAGLVHYRVCGHREWSLTKVAAWQGFAAIGIPRLLAPLSPSPHSQRGALEANLPHDILPLAANRAPLRDAA
jgi:UDP-GlcNAc:undecaprenyl-phosphate GlcNAc-1-phosphate transferase